VLLAGCGAALVVSGVQSWTARREPEQVVCNFLEAVKWGDQLAAVKLLTPDQAARAQQSVAEHVAEWVPSPDLQYRIVRVQLSPDFAVVNAAINDGGFVVQPEIALSRSADGTWQIASIGNVGVDPRWVRQQRQAQAEADEQLAHDLESSLANRPGVLVEREAQGDTRRR
jgi:hypothetical protein